MSDLLYLVNNMVGYEKAYYESLKNVTTYCSQASIDELKDLDYPTVKYLWDNLSEALPFGQFKLQLYGLYVQKELNYLKEHPTQQS